MELALTIALGIVLAPVVAVILYYLVIMAIGVPVMILTYIGIGIAKVVGGIVNLWAWLVDWITSSNRRALTFQKYRTLAPPFFKKLGLLIVNIIFWVLLVNYLLAP